MIQELNSNDQIIAVSGGIFSAAIVVGTITTSVLTVGAFYTGPGSQQRIEATIAFGKSTYESIVGFGKSVYNAALPTIKNGLTAFSNNNEMQIAAGIAAAYIFASIPMWALTPLGALLLTANAKN